MRALQASRVFVTVKHEQNTQHRQHAKQVINRTETNNDTKRTAGPQTNTSLHQCISRYIYIQNNRNKCSKQSNIHIATPTRQTGCAADDKAQVSLVCACACESFACTHRRWVARRCRELGSSFSASERASVNYIKQESKQTRLLFPRAAYDLLPSARTKTSRRAARPVWV